LIIDGTALLRIVLENPFLGRKYPQEGEALAVLDTGYEGFLAVPASIYRTLGLNELSQIHGEIILPSGEVIPTRLTYCVVEVVEAGTRLDGLVETFEELDEIVAGQELLSNLRVTLDYCRGYICVESCEP